MRETHNLSNSRLIKNILKQDKRSFKQNEEFKVINKMLLKQEIFEMQKIENNSIFLRFKIKNHLKLLYNSYFQPRNVIRKRL